MRPDEHERMFRVETRHFWFRGTRQVILAALERALGADRLPHARVLDLGCGTGFTLTQLPGSTLRVGLDYSQAALQFASQRAPDAALVRGSAYALPFEDHSFDAVLALDVLEHLEDDALAARELFRVLRPGGAAIVTVPAFRALWSAHDEALDHRRRYRLGEIASVLARAGFTVEHSSYYNFFLFPLVATARLLDRARALGRRGVPAQRSSSDLAIPPDPLNALFTAILGSERVLAPRVRLPIGVSCLVIARRDGAPRASS